ncbi:MAG: GYD domain-containing protein [Chloroflexi bacterium]|nr:GYD domain-containing protein [Chloroflexota bacterium]MDA1002682.1 GYD domain-containing protein [Chloroflexota bacterium]MQC27584.1 GYD domain-containing protein [Chloroflexota bacterium]
MATYILLLTLTTEGRAKMLEDPESLIRAEAACAADDLQFMGLYGVLGAYDFVSMVEAPDNESAARLSLELGVRCGAHIETLPAVPIARFEVGGEAVTGGERTERALPSQSGSRSRGHR